MPYDIKKFRSVKHGVSDVSAYCRHCNFSDVGSENVAIKAKQHAKKYIHTVDVYREHWTEYTSYINNQ